MSDGFGIPRLLATLRAAYFIAKGMEDGIIAATFDQRSFARSMADDIAIQIRKTEREMVENVDF